MKLTGGLRLIKETFMHKKRILLHVLFFVLFLIGIGAAAYPAFGNWYAEQKRSVVLTEYEKALAKIEDADLTDAFRQAEIYNDALFTGETDEEERPDYGELLCTALWAMWKFHPFKYACRSITAARKTSSARAQGTYRALLCPSAEEARMLF